MFFVSCIKRIAKVKKKLFENDESTEKDIIEDTPNKNVVKIDMMKKDMAKKTSIRSYNNNNSPIIIPLNMPGDEILLPSSELPVLNEHPYSNEGPVLDPTELQIPEEKNKISRKRKRRPENWKRNIQKIKRERGEEYTGAKGKSMPAKVVKPGCESTCKLMCSTNFPTDLREKIKSEFYSLTDAQKYKFYGKYTTRTKKNRKRTKKENSRRSYTFNYYFRKENESVKVCRTFFCRTLSISARRIHYFHLKMENSNTLLPPTPGKGKYVKKETPPEKINEVIDHIKSFPTVQSHYCRSSSMRQYLQPGLSVTKMYSLYLENSKSPVKENIYRKIFCERFNLGFHRPKKDVCDFCCEFKAQKNPSSDIIEKHEKHLQRKKEGDDERYKDRNLKHRENNDTAVVTFDLENIFTLPKANVSCFFYTSKLTVYNLTAHCDITKSAVNALWDETRNGRSGDDLASALVRILKEIVNALPDTVTKLILWSDSCIPQNRNSHMSTALITFLTSNDSKNITEITQKFSEPGHGNVQEVDAVHSLIERNLRHQEIYSPLSLLRALLKIKSNVLKLIITQMQDADFLSFQSEARKFGFHQIPYKQVKSITYSKKEWYIIKYQISFSGAKETIDILKNNNITILSEIVIKEANKTLTKKKIDDIRSMFKYMPVEDKMYMETLIRKAERWKGEKGNLDANKLADEKELKSRKIVKKTLNDRSEIIGGKNENKTLNAGNKTKGGKNKKDIHTEVNKTKGGKNEKKTLSAGNKVKEEKIARKPTKDKTVRKTK